MLLLDDAFDTLDPARMQAISEILVGDDLGQSLITAARKDVFETVFEFGESLNSAILVQPELPVQSA